MSSHTLIASLSLSLNSLYILYDSVPIQCELDARSETSRESTVRSNLVGNAGSRPISEAKQPWACPVLGWGTTGEAHVLYSLIISLSSPHLRSARARAQGGRGLGKNSGQSFPGSTVDLVFCLRNMARTCQIPESVELVFCLRDLARSQSR